jgi:hypothetical protein
VQAVSISGEGLGDFYEMSDSGLERILTPSFEENFRSVPTLFVPKDPELIPLNPPIQQNPLRNAYPQFQRRFSVQFPFFPSET